MQWIGELVKDQDRTRPQKRIERCQRVERGRKQIPVIVNNQPGARSEILQEGAQGLVEPAFHKTDTRVGRLWHDSTDRHCSFLRLPRNADPIFRNPFKGIETDEAAIGMGI